MVNFRKIKEALLNVDNLQSYYCGATLFIDFKYYPSVGLNLNGRGFTYGKHLKEQRFLMTKEMQKIVQTVYKKHKLEKGRGNLELFNKHKLVES